MKYKLFKGPPSLHQSVYLHVQWEYFLEAALGRFLWLNLFFFHQVVSVN